MEYTTLDKISENLDSKRKPITSSDRIEGEIPYYGASGIVDYVKDYIFDEPLLLISEDGANLLARSMPIAFSVEGKTWINNHAHVLRFRDIKLQKFVEIYLNSISLETYVTGSAQPKLNQKMLNEIPIPLLDEHQVGLVVSSIEKLKNVSDKRKQELQALDDLIKARFVELFGDPETNSMGWDLCALSEKLNVLGGYAFKSDMFDEEDGIPVLRIGNINAGYFKPINMVYWKEDESLERYAMYPGDLVMSLTGTVGKDDYGNVCILGDDYDMYYLNQRNAKLEIKEGIDKFYLSQLLKFEQIKKKLTGISRGVRQANISNKDILNLVVPIPPIELQEQFADFVQQVDKSKVAVQKALDETQLLFDSLMQQYFG